MVVHSDHSEFLDHHFREKSLLAFQCQNLQNLLWPLSYSRRVLQLMVCNLNLPSLSIKTWEKVSPSFTNSSEKIVWKTPPFFHNYKWDDTLYFNKLQCPLKENLWQVWLNFIVWDLPKLQQWWTYCQRAYRIHLYIRARFPGDRITHFVVANKNIV